MKTIAAICMLIDHMGMVFLPYQLAWRMIGRLAMPIFAFCIARGMIYTSSLKNYIRRLSVFAIISQVPFWLLRWAADGEKLITWHLNIGFTFLTAVLIIAILQKYRSRVEMSLRRKVAVSGSCIILLLAADLLGMDYGSYGVLVVMGCYLVINKEKGQLLMYMIYTFLTLLYNGSLPGLFLLQEIGVIGLVICTLTRNISERRMGKFFYIFYPLHMLVIGLMSLMIG